MAWYSNPPAEQKITPGARRLLKAIAARDEGVGVRFESEPRSRWRMHGTSMVFNAQTFRTLESLGLIDVGNGHTDPVRITAAGRVAVGGEF